MCISLLVNQWGNDLKKVLNNSIRAPLNLQSMRNGVRLDVRLD